MNAKTSALPAAALLALALTGCSAAPSTTASLTSPEGHTSPKSLPGGHVHGLAATADGSTLLIGTHHGVFDMTGASAAGTAALQPLGAPDDFMGFVGDPAGTLWASGHPGPGSAKKNPLGLVRSVDGGRTWTTVSNEGASDFHALTVTKSGLVGFDGTLKRTADGTSWSNSAASIHPAALAGHAATDTVLATTEEGLFASPDGGATWGAVPNAPLLQFAAFADARRAVGVAPEGAVYSSGDAGTTWAPTGRVESAVEAITAVASGGPVRMWAATDKGLLESRDGGATFSAYAAGSAS